MGLPRHWLEEVAAAPYQALLMPSSASLRTLNVLEAQLTLLLRLATCQRPAGAQQLVAIGVLPALDNCRLIDIEPEDAPVWASNLLPSGGVQRGALSPLPSQRLRHHQVSNKPSCRLVLLTFVLGTHVGKLYSAPTLVLSLSASCS
jgi:hypothetical protein